MSPPEPRSSLPQALAGWRLVRELGRGAFGVVHEIAAPSGERAALKRALGAVLADPDQLERFRREARATALLDHPHLVRQLAAGEERGVPWLVQELLSGGTLADRLQREGPLPPREAVILVQSLAQALEYAHERSLIHRDVKPDNVLFSGDGRPKLADFGLVRFVPPGAGLGGQLAESLSRSGDAIGSPLFMAPEQVRGEKALIGPATDVYGLGATLYEALTGTPPFPGSSTQEVLRAVLREEPAPPSRRRLPRDPEGRPRAPISPELDSLVLRCLAKQPGQRFASAEELALALAQEAEAERERALVRARSPVPGLLWAGLGLAVAALLGASAAGAFAVRQPETSPGIAGAGPSRPGLAPAGSPAGAGSPPSLGPSGPVRPTASPLASEAAAESPATEAEARAQRALERALRRARDGDREGSEAAFAEALELRPGWTRALRERGGARLLWGDAPGAYADFSRLIELLPRHASYYQLRAVTQLGDPIGDLQRALELDPTLVDAWHDLAVRRYQAGQLAEARLAIERARVLEPGLADLYFVESRILARLGDLPRAIEAVQQGLRRDPQPEWAAEFAHYLIELGEPAHALRVCGRLLEQDPGYAPALLRQAEALERLERAEEAAGSYRRLLEAAAGHPEAPDWRRRLAELEDAQ